jgi:hypothetical protein
MTFHAVPPASILTICSAAKKARDNKIPVLTNRLCFWSRCSRMRRNKNYSGTRAHMAEIRKNMGTHVDLCEEVLNIRGSHYRLAFSRTTNLGRDHCIIKNIIFWIIIPIINNRLLLFPLKKTSNCESRWQIQFSHNWLALVR